MEIYLDNSATTRCYDEVAELMTTVMTQAYGNPSSLHSKGLEAEKYIKEATDAIAGTLKVKDKEILYTSGGTESDNLAIIGSCMANRRSGNHIITTKIEHPAVLEPIEFLKEQGFEVDYLSVDRNGLIDIEELNRVLRKDTILVSVMHTNNEIGSIEPIDQIGSLLKAADHKILFHVDAVQGFGKAHIYPKRSGIDLLSVSGHKIHGPKGTGFLYIDEKVKIKPIIFGGGQQKGLRSGTENVPSIAGLGMAVRLIYKDLDKKLENMYDLKEYFINELRKTEGVAQINGIGDDPRLSAPHIISVSFEDIRAEVLLHALEEREIYVSSGSACSSNKPSVSKTLTSIGLDRKYLDSTIRFSLSFDTTREDICHTVDTLREILPFLRRFVRK
ncbi:MAG: cysteine desulfurase [Lachnospiraceae bacterium]|nr:cysteine desulfurase [Lachnospiraceae bacterium]